MRVLTTLKLFPQEINDAERKKERKEKGNNKNTALLKYQEPEKMEKFLYKSNHLTLTMGQWFKCKVNCCVFFYQKYIKLATLEDHTL